MPHANRPRKIAIVGAGFAGLASAALLAKSGHRVTVYEKFTQPQSIGAGILLQPSGLAALRALGIHDEVVAQGARVEHLYGVTPRQRPVIDVRYRDWHRDAYGLGLHRGVLFNALWNLARRHGVDIATGQEVRTLSELQARHDLTVIADGARSLLRAQTGLPVRERLYPWGALWAVLADPQQSHGTTLWQWYRAAHQMLGIMPTGRAPASAMPVVSLFWSLPAARHAAWREAGLSAFKQQVLALHPHCGALLEQIHTMEQLTWARYHDVVMPRYHTEHAVVIGDAAHATSPQLGQGTNLALLDALVLNQCLNAHARLPQALSAYTARRRPHLHYYGQASRWLTPLFQSDWRVLPWLRDCFMGASAGWPVAGNLSRQTLVGTRQSWWPFGKGSQLDLHALTHGEDDAPPVG